MRRVNGPGVGVTTGPIVTLPDKRDEAKVAAKCKTPWRPAPKIVLGYFID